MQLNRNRKIDVLIVDDSQTVRAYIKRLLLIYPFRISEAKNGIDALQKLQENKNISLVLTEFKWA